MADNSIDMVREAEVKADETLREASQRAAQIVDEAYAKAVEIANTAEDEARAQAASQVAAAHEENKKILEQAIGELGGEIEDFKAKARENQVQAVMAVLRSIA